MARTGQGKRGFYRMVMAIRVQDRAVFLFGFAKNDMDTIGDRQRAWLHDIAAMLLTADNEKLRQAMADELLFEVRHGGQNENRP